MNETVERMKIRDSFFYAWAYLRSLMWRNWYMGSHSSPPFEGNQYAIGQSESTCHYALAPPSGFNVYFEIGVQLHLCRHYRDHNQRNPTSSYFIRAHHHWYVAATKYTEYDPHAANYQNSYHHKYHCHVPISNKSSARCQQDHQHNMMAKRSSRQHDDN